MPCGEGLFSAGAKPGRLSVLLPQITSGPEVAKTPLAQSDRFAPSVGNVTAVSPGSDRTQSEKSAYDGRCFLRSGLNRAPSKARSPEQRAAGLPAEAPAPATAAAKRAAAEWKLCAARRPCAGGLEARTLLQSTNQLSVSYRSSSLTFALLRDSHAKRHNRFLSTWKRIRLCLSCRSKSCPTRRSRPRRAECQSH